MKALLALSTVLGALTPPAAQPAPYSAVHLVRCGASSGTAFQIAPGRLLTAAHVTQNGPCSIDGEPVETVHEDRRNDIAELRGNPGKASLRISCRRPKRGQVFHAIGYAGGRYRIDARIIATGKKFAPDYLPGVKGADLFYGNTIPGMSGGPNLLDGRVVTIINAGAPNIHSVAGRALADTYICQGKR
jgi:hypothetical protein